MPEYRDISAFLLLSQLKLICCWNLSGIYALPCMANRLKAEPFGPAFLIMLMHE